jgi:hypothetical protein
VQGLGFLWLLLEEEEELNWKNQKMGTNQNPKEILKNTIAPSTALAYLDPQYWYFFFFSLITPGFSLISSSCWCWCWCWCCCCFRDEHFSNEEHYEWFKDYSHFRHLIQAHIKPNSSVISLSLSLSLSVFFFFF